MHCLITPHLNMSVFGRKEKHDPTFDARAYLKTLDQSKVATFARDRAIEVLTSKVSTTQTSSDATDTTHRRLVSPTATHLTMCMQVHVSQTVQQALDDSSIMKQAFAQLKNTNYTKNHKKATALLTK